MSEVSRIVDGTDQVDPRAAEDLLPLVYDELRKLAAAKMAGQAEGHTLQPTALVHEAWLRLSRSGPAQWNSRGHFFAAAAEAMRRILVEGARQRASQKRGGRWQRLNLEDVDVAEETSPDVLILVDECLQSYAEKDPIGAQLISLRFFVGLPNHEAAELLGVPERTAKRTWAFARAWLYAEIQKQAGTQK